jgi:hypothetical protein
VEASYVILILPIVASEGSHVPDELLLMPGPLHVPPEDAASKSTGGSLTQKLPGFVIVASGTSNTSITISSVSEQSELDTS